MESTLMEAYEYYEVKISAEDQAQADTILNSLLDQKLVTGGQFVSSPARFLWKGEINDTTEYITITSYTTSMHLQALINDVRRTTQEEVPMITVVTLTALNTELQGWIDASLELAEPDPDSPGDD
jgi:uncharacterized protein involved in tolerance to divalent cations